MNPDQIHDAMMPNPADDVPYQVDRPVVLQDNTYKRYDGFLSRTHENNIRTLLAIGWQVVEQHDGEWVTVEFKP